jgi:membrane-anchored protein YejM (alkaline phosphatase superfamily)
MPILLRLSRQGISVDPAYSHSGTTTSSIQHIFSGHLAYKHDSLVKDFKSFGYKVGVFSTQDEDFGHTRQICSFGDADCYFDASMAPNERLTAYSTPSTMIIPAKRVIHEVVKFLEASHQDKPVFTYVHMETTHFPYSHETAQSSGKKLVTGNSLPENRDELVVRYRKAAGTLDAQIDELTAEFQSRRHNTPLIIILGDHGESLFDDGIVGHGLITNEIQTRVVCVIVNAWSDIPVPFGLVDFRPWLLRMLQTPRSAHATPRLYTTKRAVFQYCGDINSPSRIAEVSLEGRITANFLQGVFIDQNKVEITFDQAISNPEYLGLVHRWQALHYLRSLER